MVWERRLVWSVKADALWYNLVDFHLLLVNLPPPGLEMMLELAHFPAQTIHPVPVLFPFS